MLDISLLELFEKSIKENWNLPALTDFEIRTLNYSEVAKLVLKLGQFYRNAGISKGDKIAVSGKNSINWALVYLSALSYGAIIVPILSDFSTEDIQNTVNHSDAKLLFADSSICNGLELSKMNNLMSLMNLDSLEIYFKTGDKIEEAWTLANKYYDEKLETITAEDFEFPHKIGNEDIATIIYTSGTTGFSKGVILNLNSLTANVKYAQKNFSMSTKSSIVSFLPLAHCFGCAFDFL
ncbi:MAG: acyl--CoA ligase, partial [Candidatus Heimdallarchaeota archaeon]|nr:acyl--CoA ligase [Candidatus Heimdallarchaeota archaeon]